MSIRVNEYMSKDFFLFKKACGAEDIAMYESMGEQIATDTNDIYKIDIEIFYECK